MFFFCCMGDEVWWYKREVWWHFASCIHTGTPILLQLKDLKNYHKHGDSLR